MPLPTFLSNPDCVVGIPVWRAKCMSSKKVDSLVVEGFVV